MTADQIIQLAHQCQLLMIAVPIAVAIIACTGIICRQCDRENKRAAKEAERNHIERMNRK